MTTCFHIWEPQENAIFLSPFSIYFFFIANFDITNAFKTHFYINLAQIMSKKWSEKEITTRHICFISNWQQFFEFFKGLIVCCTNTLNHETTELHANSISNHIGHAHTDEEMIVRTCFHFSKEARKKCRSWHSKNLRSTNAPFLFCFWLTDWRLSSFSQSFFFPSLKQTDRKEQWQQSCGGGTASLTGSRASSGNRRWSWLSLVSRTAARRPSSTSSLFVHNTLLLFPIPHQHQHLTPLKHLCTR